ncbi:unnamed protein product [Amoebophrya sp. A120]|nr:unnamed protein product [Amoebophrya sp. A120]|eukprot:GSA120T00006304001.1
MNVSSAGEDNQRTPRCGFVPELHLFGEQETRLLLIGQVSVAIFPVILVIFRNYKVEDRSKISEYQLTV